MAWLRIDDGFWQHPKFEGWTGAEKWAFGELMGYCAKYRNHGRVPTDLNLLPRSVTAARIRKAERAGWLDRDEKGVLWIHDWLIYNGETVAVKVAYYLKRHPAATANEVAKAVGGTRNIVLAEVAAQRANGTKGGTAVPLAVPADGTETGTESGTRARAPVPKNTKDP